MVFTFFFPSQFFSTYGDWKGWSTSAWPWQVTECFLGPLFHTVGYPPASVFLVSIKHSRNADEVSGILPPPITKWSFGNESQGCFHKQMPCTNQEFCHRLWQRQLDIMRIKNQLNPLLGMLRWGQHYRSCNYCWIVGLYQLLVWTHLVHSQSSCRQQQCLRNIKINSWSLSWM